MVYTSIFLTTYWRIVYALLLPLAFSQTISVHVQRFKMCNINQQGFLSLLFAGVQDGLRFLRPGLKTHIPAFPTQTNMTVPLVQVIIFRGVTQSLKFQDGSCWRQPLKNQQRAWPAVERGKGNASTRQKEPEHVVNIGCHDGGPERVKCHNSLAGQIP